MVTSRYWPFGVRWAFLASVIMVPTLVAVGVWLYRPDGPLATRLTFAPLLIAVVLGLLPVVLVILGGVRSVAAGGVTVAFAAVQDVVSAKGVVTARSLIADNLGNPPGSVADTGSDTIISSLKDAVGNFSVVADLREGEEWWATRLLVLVSGAVRLAFPRAVVFTCADPDHARRFLGWATPSDLLRRLLAREPMLREAYLESQRDWLLWQLGVQTPSGRVLPWAASGRMQKSKAAGVTLPQFPDPGVDSMTELPWPSWIASPTPWVMREDGFEAERLLLSQLSPLEGPGRSWSLTEVRVRELFGSVLHTEAVDPDDDEATWVETILGSTADFFAVTSGQQFVNLVPRRTAVNAVLLALISDNERAQRARSSPNNERRRSG